RLEALSDIRARRARMKQLQSKASDTSSNASSEEGEIVCRGGSEMEISGDEGIGLGSETIPAGTDKGDESIDNKLPKKRPAGRLEESEGGSSNLFAEDRYHFLMVV
ncbi:hypothetical protein, conserved, partial [Eimeria maxima]